MIPLFPYWTSGLPSLLKWLFRRNGRRAHLEGRSALCCHKQPRQGLFLWLGVPWQALCACPVVIHSTSASAGDLDDKEALGPPAHLLLVPQWVMLLDMFHWSSIIVLSYGLFHFHRRGQVSHFSMPSSMQKCKWQKGRHSSSSLEAFQGLQPALKQGCLSWILSQDNSTWETKC